MHLLRLLVDEEDGATAIEYGLIAGLVAVVIIGSLTLLGNNLSAIFEQLATTFE